MTDAAHRGTSPVQARGDLDGGDEASIHEVAASGVAGGGSSLPHLERIQSSFGEAHDLTGVRAHVGGAAAAASESMGASAYATGDDVAFHGAPDLHTAAHEAAHVVQQRAGVSLSGGVGEAGDRYESNADAVADRVAGGDSAADLLAPFAGGEGAGAVQRQVQRRLWIGARKASEAQLVTPPGAIAPEDLGALMARSAGAVGFEDTWTQVRAGLCAFLEVEPGELDEGVEARVRAKFTDWCDRISAIENKRRSQPDVAPQDNPDMAAYTEERVYAGASQLAIALYHESAPGYEGKVAQEDQLAAMVKADGAYTAAMTTVVQALGGTLSPDDYEELALLAVQSRYGAFSELARAEEVTAGGGDMSAMVILLDEYTGYSPVAQQPEFKALKVDMRKEFGDIRNNGWTVNESNEWVQKIRALGMPLQAGPSGTTNRVLALARMLGCSNEVVCRVAWVMFAFFNGMWRGQSGTHRLAEVMAVAELHCNGVDAYRPQVPKL